MKKKCFLLTGCFYLLIFLLATGPCLGKNNVYQGKRIPGNIPKDIPGIVKLPDLIITHIYTKKYMGKQGVWADIKNASGPIPEKEFNKADMRFYLSPT